MPSEDPIVRLGDIIENARRIRDYTADLTRETFLQDQKTIDAVERCFERIAEASRKIGDRFDAKYPELKLNNLRGFGNILRHDYVSIAPHLLWSFKENELAGLEAMAQSELAELARLKD
ncbi:MAG: DUF86 domain-containing protein [Rhodospirillaceae bacterium]|nr:DUF86 domain-containing protein [Rhodospirillaceae bacterium]